MDNHTKHSVIHYLEQLRVPFEPVVRRTEVVQFGPRTFYLKPTLSVRKMKEAKIESIKDVVLAWPEDDREVRLTWAYEGFALTGRIMGKPMTDNAGRWKCSMTAQVKCDGVLVAEIKPAIDVDFDNTPRPPHILIDYLSTKIREGKIIEEKHF